MEREDKVQDLLAQLNRWAQMVKTRQGDDPLYKDKGEANARIADLKDQLAALGVAVRWNGQEYVVETGTDQGSGEIFGKR